MNAAKESVSSALFTRAEAARYLGVSSSTLATWACTRRYKLPYVKVGRLSKYRKMDLEAFIANGLVMSEAA